MTTGTITFTTSAALALWNCEVLGQLSDGMWENTAPHDHWEFWHNLAPQLGGTNVVETNSSWLCRKTGYNLVALLQYVQDRMLSFGRMGMHTPEKDAVRAAEYMPATLAEFKAQKSSGKWKYEHVTKYMENVSDDLAEKFYATSYTVKELKADLKVIKAAMKSMANN